MTINLEDVLITDGNGKDITELWGVPGEMLTFYVELAEETKLPAAFTAKEYNLTIQLPEDLSMTVMYN